jgi:rubrerythrin
MPSVEQFRERMERQKEQELYAEEVYSRFAAELGKGKYAEMFAEISEQEREHARIVDEIIALLG